MSVPVLIRTSERATYRRCRQKWYWKYHQLLASPRRKTALSFGTIIHQALEGWYPPGIHRGIDPVETFLKLLKEEENLAAFGQWDEDGNKVSVEDLGTAMLLGYLEEYGQDDDIEIIAPEQTFAIDVLDKSGNYLCTYVGKIDATARRRSNGKLLLLEHKTAKTIEDVVINSGYGEQGLSYLWAATIMLRDSGAIGPEEFFDGVLYNFLRKGLPDDRPRDEQGYYLNRPTKASLTDACASEFLKTTGTVAALTARLKYSGWTDEEILGLGEISSRQSSPLYARQDLIVQPHALGRFQTRLRAEAWEMNLVRENKLPVYKNPTKDCKWECEYRDMCELHEMGGDWRSFRELELGRWDPYSDHEYLEEKN